MRLLLDEDMPHAFRHCLPGHDVWTVQYMGWNSKKNGELLALAQNEFDVLITLDQKIPYQQNLTSADVGVLILVAGTDNARALENLTPQIMEALPDIKRGEVVHVYPPY